MLFSFASNSLIHRESVDSLQNGTAGYIFLRNRNHVSTNKTRCSCVWYEKTNFLSILGQCILVNVTT